MAAIILFIHYHIVFLYICTWSLGDFVQKSLITKFIGFGESPVQADHISIPEEVAGVQVDKADEILHRDVALPVQVHVLHIEEVLLQQGNLHALVHAHLPEIQSLLIRRQ